ncbi:DKNYY domain-containing protein [Chryseobacterium sp. BIGb0232]
MIVSDADSKTFKSLDDSYYAIDNKNCYYRGNIIKKVLQ